MNNTQLWLRGLAAAAIGGLSTAGTAYFVAPQAFTFDKNGAIALAKALILGTVVPVFAYLKQSPLPAASITTTASTTVDVTKKD